MPLRSSVKESNDLHKRWVARTLESLFGALRGMTVGVWGLTYKPGTNTPRRSSAIELCDWLAGQGVNVRAHDPTIRALPQGAAGSVTLCESAVEAARGADAVVLAPKWPECRTLSLDRIPPGPVPLTIIAPGRFLATPLPESVKFDT